MYSGPFEFPSRQGQDDAVICPTCLGGAQADFLLRISAEGGWRRLVGFPSSRAHRVPFSRACRATTCNSGPSNPLTRQHCNAPILTEFDPAPQFAMLGSRATDSPKLWGPRHQAAFLPAQEAAAATATPAPATASPKRTTAAHNVNGKRPADEQQQQQNQNESASVSAASGGPRVRPGFKMKRTGHSGPFPFSGRPAHPPTAPAPSSSVPSAPNPGSHGAGPGHDASQPMPKLTAVRDTPRETGPITTPTAKTKPQPQPQPQRHQQVQTKPETSYNQTTVSTHVRVITYYPSTIWILLFISFLVMADPFTFLPPNRTLGNPPSAPSHR